MLRAFASAFLLVFSTAIPAQAQTRSPKVNDGTFTLLQLFTDDKDRFIREWSQPTPPKLTTTSKTVRDKPIYMALIIAGCAGDSSGKCDVSGDIVITDPSGKVYGNYKGLPIWKEDSAQPEMLRLSPTMLGMTVEKGELLGGYRMAVSVTDNVAKKTLRIENLVTVSEAVDPNI